jgi:hypothetical protein
MLYILLFLFIAAINKAIMDKLVFHYEKSIFSKFKNENWWDKTKSYKNKWKNGNQEDGERFWGSSRWFVSFTDAWHLHQKVFLTFIFLSVVFYEKQFGYFIDFCLFYMFFTATFEIFFGYIFNKDRNLKKFLKIF